MFTQNYMKFQKIRFCWGEETFTLCDGTTQKMNGTVNNTQSCPQYWADIGTAMSRPKCQEVANSTAYNAESNLTQIGMFFGTSSTPATVNDYNLGAVITSGLTPSMVGTVDIGGGDGQYYAEATYQLKNTTGADINIWEIGAFGQMFYSGKGAMPILFERTVLSEPITIPAGGSKLVTYKITFNQVLNIE